MKFPVRLFLLLNFNLITSVAALLMLIQAYNSVRERHYLRRQAIVSAKLSPWMKLYLYGDDISFLNLTGFTREAFKKLRKILFEHKFGIFKNRITNRNNGRPPLLDYNGQLGLLLYFLNSTLKEKHLCQLFGVTPAVCSRIINRMLELTYSKLKVNNIAKVKWPNEAEMALLASLVHNREPTVSDVIGFTDGCSIPIQCSSDPIEQAKFYNGYQSDTMVNNVFCFAPTGKIIDLEEKQ